MDSGESFEISIKNKEKLRNCPLDKILIMPYSEFIVEEHDHSIKELMMLYMPREEGQGLVEYALILVLVAVVVIVILALIGPAIGGIFSNVVGNL